MAEQSNCRQRHAEASADAYAPIAYSCLASINASDARWSQVCAVIDCNGPCGLLACRVDASGCGRFVKFADAREAFVVARADAIGLAVSGL